MKITDIPIDKLHGAPWNPNRMDEATIGRLRESLSSYGLLQPLVVRRIGRSKYEVLSGNQRLGILQEKGIEKVPCVIVDLNDSRAMLLAEALNAIRGEDDLAFKGALLKNVLAAIPQDKVLSLLPETAKSLTALSTIGQGDLAQHLEAWQKAQAARLRHMQLQFSKEQQETVEKAINMVIARAKNLTGTNPNVRGTVIYLLARFYLERNKRR